MNLIPKNSKTALVQETAKIDVFPSPEPFGVSTTSDRIINPEPNLSNISIRSPPFLGIIPHTNKHAFCSEKGSKGSSISCNSFISENLFFSLISFDSNIIFFALFFLYKFPQVCYHLIILEI